MKNSERIEYRDRVEFRDRVENTHSVEYVNVKVEDTDKIRDLESKLLAMLAEMNSNKELLEDMEKRLEEERQKKQ